MDPIRGDRFATGLRYVPAVVFSGAVGTEVKMEVTGILAAAGTVIGYGARWVQEWLTYEYRAFEISSVACSSMACVW